MDNDQTNDDIALEALFDAAKDDAPEMSDTFMARLTADAAVAVPVPTPAPAIASEPMFGKLRGFFAASGLTGAAMVGVWIGFVMPETLNTFADGLSTEDTVSLSAFLPGADLTALAE